MRRVLPLLTISAIAVVLIACSGGDTSRTISVRMFDDLRYDPDQFDVNVGQTVSFEVRNSGQVAHEFFIGTLDEHRDHAEEMRQSDHAAEAHVNPSGVTLDPGESGSLTYTFAEPGEMLVGCHEPGHYEAGMVAPITVHP